MFHSTLFRSFRPIFTVLIACTVLVAAIEASPSAATAAQPQAGGNGPAAAAPSIGYIREFPKSNPEYFSITVSQTGEASYASAPDDTQPVTFRLSDPLVTQLFEAASRLGEFRQIDLELRTGPKVAFMGKKTLIYQAGSTRNQTSFNFSANPDAQALVSAFEKIGITERYVLDLERTVRFDRLGTYDVVLQIEKALNGRDLVEPSQFLPLLQKVIADSRFMHVAQEHARAIVNVVQSGRYTPNIEFNQSGK